MHHYFDQILETAGLYNTVGFNDDTRTFLSIPTRHDLWRRASVSWLSRLVIEAIIDMEDATSIGYDMVYGLARLAYKLE